MLETKSGYRSVRKFHRMRIRILRVRNFLLHILVFFFIKFFRDNYFFFFSNNIKEKIDTVLYNASTVGLRNCFVLIHFLYFFYLKFQFY